MSLDGLHHISRVLLLASAIALAGCPSFSEEENNEENNASANNTSANNGATNNTSTNNGSTNNASTNNTSANNTSANNGSTNNTSTNNTSTNNTSANNTSTNNGSTNNTSTNNTSANNTSTNNTSTNNSTVQLEERDCTTVVEYDGAPAAGAVTISGEFNAWDTMATPMQKNGSTWRAELELEPGHYAYKFVIDGNYEGNPPPDVPTKWDGDFENRNLIVEDCTIPTWRVVSTEVTATGTLRATLQFVSGFGGEAIDPASVRVTFGDEEATPQVSDTGEVTVEYTAPAHGKYSLRAWAKDLDGNATEDNPLWIPMWYEEEPFEWQDATMYLIFTDRFLDSDGTSPVAPIQNVAPIAGYMGGDFNGIIQKIDDGYFDDLGVNLLWLSPIYENTEQAWIGADGVNNFTGYHGYWPIDPLTSESRYGDAMASSDERLEELIDKAHARGIRVLFDVVHNHVHEDHVYCQENPSWCEVTCTCGSAGCGWDENPLFCQFAPYLPDLSYRKHDVLQRQLDDTIKLAEMFDVDGFRVDAAKHMDHVIMRSLRRRTKEIEANGGAPFYTVGETYTFTDGHGLIMNYVADYELHGQFDFPLLYPIRDVFGKDALGFRQLEAAVATSEQAYGAAYKWMSPFLGNHDIPRFVTDSLGNDWDPWDSSIDVMAQGPMAMITPDQWNIINRMSMGFAFLLTQPGIPLIYYGDEIGLAGSADPDNRRMMDWTWNAGQQELYDRVKTISQARRELEPLRRGDRRELWVDDTLYVYARYTATGAVIVAMNKGATRSEMVTIPATLGLDGKTLDSYTSTRQLTVTGGMANVELDPWEYAIFHVPNP